MSEQAVVFQYQPGTVVGGYSFSIKNNIITLPGHVERLENAVAREAIQFEATKARSFYVNEVKRLKASGVKVNSVLAKREAITQAREETRTKYSDIWGEVENARKVPFHAPKVVTADVQNTNSHTSTVQAPCLIVICTGNLNQQTKEEAGKFAMNHNRLVMAQTETLSNVPYCIIYTHSSKEALSVIEKCLSDTDPISTFFTKK